MASRFTSLRVSPDPKSMDLLRRVAGTSRITGGDVDLEDWHLRVIFLVQDPYAVLVSCGGVHALAIPAAGSNIKRWVYLLFLT